MTDAPNTPVTAGNEFQPLRVAGIQVVQSYTQIADVLQRTVGAANAALLAEPSIDQTNGDIRWYPQVAGEARPLAALPAEDRRKAELRLGELIEDIYRHADRLAASTNGADRLMADNLRLAVEVPKGADNVLVVGEQPVIYGWGHVPRGPAEPQHLLRELVRRRIEEERRAAAPPPISAPMTEGESVGIERLGNDRWRMHVFSAVKTPFLALHGWWLSSLCWLLFTLLLLAIGWLLLRYCGLGWPSAVVVAERAILDYCPAPMISAPVDEAGLRRHVEQLDDLIQRRQDACTPPPPPPPPPPCPQCPAAPPCPQCPPPPPPPPEESEACKRLRQERGRIGAVNVILLWDTNDDLDLHVMCPNGRRIYFDHKVDCGGTLDVDRNSNESTTVASPVENVVWQEGRAPPGKYVALVERYSTRQSVGRPISFTLELKINGRTAETRRMSVSRDGERLRVLEFDLPWNRPLPGDPTDCPPAPGGATPPTQR